MRAVALALLLIATPAWAVEYPSNSVGTLLHGYGEDFSSGWIGGFLDAFVVTGGRCPMGVSPNMLMATLKTRVQSGDIALTDGDRHGLIKSLASLGCTHPFGTKNKVTT